MSESNSLINPNKALWEKGDFTRIAETMRESGDWVRMFPVLILPATWVPLETSEFKRRA